MLAFQPRGFVSELVGMRLFIYKYSEAESSHFFRHYETSALWDFFSKFFKCPRRVILSIFLIFCNRPNVKNPKGSLFSKFSALWDCSKFSFFVFRNFFQRLLIFFQKFSRSTKGPPFSLFDILQQNECWKIPKGPFQIFWHYVKWLKFYFSSTYAYYNIAIIKKN